VTALVVLLIALIFLSLPFLQRLLGAIVWFAILAYASQRHRPLASATGFWRRSLRRASLSPHHLSDCGTQVVSFSIPRRRRIADSSFPIRQ
jgi:hypothetical protein